MKSMRKKYDAAFKAKVAIEAIKGESTVAELSSEEKRMSIEPAYPQISVSRQCELLGLARSSFYYEPQRNDSYNELLIRLIDEQYTQTPFYGVRRITAWLRKTGHAVNHKRVARLMDLMGLEAIYPKPKTSKAHPEHKKYPYLLKGLEIDYPNQVWATDITYIRMKKGFV